MAEADVKVESIQEAIAESVSGCEGNQGKDPCIVVVFGATGDLTARKLFPALHRLFVSGSMPQNFCIVGAARSELSDEGFRAEMKKAATEHSDSGTEKWDDIAPRLFYRQIQYDELATFKKLSKELKKLDKEHGTEGNYLLYLALPPSTYEDMATMLGKSGLSDQSNGNWARIVVEKPFGHDLASARKLDATLHEHFEEHQIFRIDHYLAKETVQDILMLRFANAIFEPIWNRQYIDYVRIVAAESLGVGHRAGYYDDAGVLRDMFQNHMMQLLSLCTIEPPSLFEADRVRDEKAKVYRALRPFDMENLEQSLVMGQYSAGVVNGEKVKAYIDEPGVSDNSVTPTFALMKVNVDNWRWQGVPFYLASGKRLAAKRTEIAVQFKEVPYSMFRKVLGEHITANRLVLGIQPKEEISLTFQTKTPGPKACLRSVTMHFDYNKGYSGPKLDAYEKVLLDVMLGDHTLFWRQDSVELCWGFLTPILRECDCPEWHDRIYLYKAGSWGPQEAKNLIDLEE
jgi:glucose-6-phosphate 1-dehydrogenase